MGIVRVLKRKDAASVVVAVVLAMIVAQLLPTLTSKLATSIVGLEDGQAVSYSVPGAGWDVTYLYPVVWALLQVVLLELLIWVYVTVYAALRNKK